MTQNQLAVISPRDGLAGFLSHNEKVVSLIAPASQEGRTVCAGNYATRFPDTAVVEVTDREEAITYLAEHQENSLTLDFTLLLFDRDVNWRTRKNVSRELNEMLATEHCREYVLDIMLASPLPDEADSKGATDAASSENRVRSLIETVVNSQDRVCKAHSAWLALRAEPMVQQAGTDKILGSLIQLGVFRRLVEEGTTRADVASLKAGIVLDPRLTGRCDPRIVTKLIAEYSSDLPAGLCAVSAISPSVEPSLLSEATGEIHGTTRSGSRGNADTMRAQAESQVERIADLFGQGSDQPATQFLKELVGSQVRNCSDHSHVVKSLCNIATRCVINGRRDISLDCLNQALAFEAGIDAVLYLQIGNSLRSLNSYERAIKCYEKALELDDGEKSEAIRLEIIRVSVAKGDYEKALASYLQLPQLHYQPQTLCALGTLYRKMGDLRKARESFWGVLDLDPSFHPARAGLAEANKQSGRHSKAIKRYNAILSEFPDLDEGALKVYSLALSFLFRLTHQRENAAELLAELHTKYPMDCDVHLQLAKLYMLEGDTARAKSHFQRAHGPSLDRLAAQLYLTAIGEPITESRDIGSGRRLSDIDLPENQGLVNCDQAFWAIRNEDYGRVKTIVKSSRYVDRLHADFGAVLGYHAEKTVDPTFNYKSDQVICRIAKRGYKELRQSVHAISIGDFAGAEELERRMCLLIA